MHKLKLFSLTAYQAKLLYNERCDIPVKIDDKVYQFKFVSEKEEVITKDLFKETFEKIVTIILMDKERGLEYSGQIFISKGDLFINTIFELITD